MIITTGRGCRVPGCNRPLVQSKRFCDGHNDLAMKGRRAEDMPLCRPGERELIEMIVRMYVELSGPSQIQVCAAMSAQVQRDRLREEAAA